MPITAPSLKQISAIGGFDYTSKAAVPMKTFVDAVSAQSVAVDNVRTYITDTVPAALLGAGADKTDYPAVIDAAATVTAVKVILDGVPGQQPAANPNDLVLTLKKGATVIATRTYTAAMPAAGVASALTLSGTPANLDLAAGDVLAFEVTQNGACALSPASLQLVVAMVPKA